MMFGATHRPERHRPRIPPVEQGIERPLWSVMIPSYNCAELLRETLRSVLAQDPGPDRMQIEVVDDRSTRDDPESVVREIGGGRVGFYRQPRNLGHVGNFNTCLLRARGHLVHLLHGDDYVLPGFYEAMGAPFAADPAIGMAFCRSDYVDESGTRVFLGEAEQPEPGIVDGWLTTIASGQRIATPSVVARREVYETLRGFDDRFYRAGEDWEMWVRIAAAFPVWYEPACLVAYRIVRPGSLTDSTRHNARMIRDMRVATDIIADTLAERLPPTEAREALRAARWMYAGWAVKHAHQLLLDRRPHRSLLLLWEALRCSRSPWVYRAVAKELSLIGRNGLRRLLRRRAKKN